MAWIDRWVQYKQEAVTGSQSNAYTTHMPMWCHCSVEVCHTECSCCNSGSLSSRNISFVLPQNTWCATRTDSRMSWLSLQLLPAHHQVCKAFVTVTEAKHLLHGLIPSKFANAFSGTIPKVMLLLLLPTLGCTVCVVVAVQASQITRVRPHATLDHTQPATARLVSITTINRRCILAWGFLIGVSLTRYCVRPLRGWCCLCGSPGVGFISLMQPVACVLFSHDGNCVLLLRLKRFHTTVPTQGQLLSHTEVIGTAIFTATVAGCQPELRAPLNDALDIQKGGFVPDKKEFQDFSLCRSGG